MLSNQEWGDEPPEVLRNRRELNANYNGRYKRVGKGSPHVRLVQRFRGRGRKWRSTLQLLLSRKTVTSNLGKECGCGQDAFATPSAQGPSGAAGRPHPSRATPDPELTHFSGSAPAVPALVRFMRPSPEETTSEPRFVIWRFGEREENSLRERGEDFESGARRWTRNPGESLPQGEATALPPAPHLPKENLQMSKVGVEVPAAAAPPQGASAVAGGRGRERERKRPQLRAQQLAKGPPSGQGLGRTQSLNMATPEVCVAEVPGSCSASVSGA